jgi:hypothetical protein
VFIGLANRARVADVSLHDERGRLAVSHLDDLECVASARDPVAGLPRRRVQLHVCEPPALLVLEPERCHSFPGPGGEAKATGWRRVASLGGFCIGDLFLDIL